MVLESISTLAIAIIFIIFIDIIYIPRDLCIVVTEGNKQLKFIINCTLLKSISEYFKQK